MSHGADFYDFVSRDATFGACFDAAMRSDSRFVSEILVRECGKVFTG
jgi:hypothetical protein